jgi:hypothetical protein
VTSWTGFCADHNIELSINNYNIELSINNFTGADGIKETFSRAKGIVAYFHRSTAGIQDLADSHFGRVGSTVSDALKGRTCPRRSASRSCTSGL